MSEEGREEWSRAHILKLIEAYRCHECLWNIKCPLYSDRNRRNCAWKQLAATVGYDIRSVEKKMKTLKTQFMHCYKHSKKYSASTGEVFQPKWFAYNNLKFLLPGKIYRERRDYLKRKQEDYVIKDAMLPDSDGEITSVDPEFVEIIQEPLMEETSRIPPTPRIINSAINNSDVIRTPSNSITLGSIGPKVSHIDEHSGHPYHHPEHFTNNTTNGLTHPNRDEFTVFGEHVAFRLRNITDTRARLIAQYQINNILFEAELGGIPPSRVSLTSSIPEHHNGDLLSPKLETISCNNSPVH